MKQHSNVITYKFDDTFSSKIYNFYQLSFFDSNGNYDYLALAKLAGCAFLELAETSFYVRPINLNNSNNYFMVMSVATIFHSLKEFFYSDLITQHVTQNAERNIVNEWGVTFNNNTNLEITDHQAVFLKNSINASTPRHLVSQAMVEVECGTYQFGNVLRGALGGSVKLTSSLLSMSKGNFGPLLYNSAAFLSIYLISGPTFQLFEKTKQNYVQLKNVPFSNFTNLEIIQKSIDLLDQIKDSENGQSQLKATHAIVDGVHDVLSNRGGAYEISRAWQAKEINHQDSQKISAEFKESTYIIQWLSGNNFRFIDVWHRFEQINRYLEAIIKFRDLDSKEINTSYVEQDANLSGEINDEN